MNDNDTRLILEALEFCLRHWADQELEGERDQLHDKICKQLREAEQQSIRKLVDKVLKGQLTITGSDHTIQKER